jgi:ribosomal protein L11 methyltransferase
VEYAVYGAPGELPALEEGDAEVAGVRVRVSGTEVSDDWAERWKRFHSPVLVDGRVYVRPPWEQAPARPDAIDVVIDPGRAFGTGAHPTTRLCVELMLDLADRGAARGSLADLGCGSGVLAIVGRKLGWDPITAVDSDLAAVEAAGANARDNGVRLDRVERANLREDPAPGADTVVANLMRNLLLRVAEHIRHTPNALVMSGLLEHEADEVVEAFAPLREVRRVRNRGWAAVLLERA